MVAPWVAPGVKTTAHNRQQTKTTAPECGGYWYPRRESNPGTRFRKPLLYPLSYEGLFRFLLRLALGGNMLKSPLDHLVDHNLLILLQNMYIDLERRARLGVSQASPS